MTQGSQGRPIRSSDPRAASIPPAGRPSAEHVRALEAAGLLEVRLLKKSVQRPLMSVWLGEDKNNEKVFLTVVDACGTPAERDRVIGSAKSLVALSGTTGVQNVRRVLEDVDAFISDYFGAGTAADLVVLRWPSQRKLDFACRICDALAELHAAGITHGCVCPDNILLDDDLRPVVTEAGMVSIQSSLEGDPENFFGYGAYAAPETVSGAPGPLGDVFSMGRLLTFIMLDRAPGEASDAMDLNAKEPSIAAIVRRCTGQPAERFDSMAALSAELQRCRNLLVPSEGETAKRLPTMPPPRARASVAAPAPTPAAALKAGLDKPSGPWAAPWWVGAASAAAFVGCIAIAGLASARSPLLHAVLAFVATAAVVGSTLVVPTTTRLRAALIFFGLVVGVVLDPVGRASGLNANDAPGRAAAARVFILKGGKDLRGMRLENADLSGLDLKGAQLSGADVTGANLSRTKLNSAEVQGVTFVLAHLEGADLTDVALDKAVAIETASCDGSTVFPEGWSCGADQKTHRGAAPAAR